MVGSGVAKPWHTRSRARATFACALAFWPEDPADVISEVLNSKLSLGGGGGMPPDPPKRACFRTLTFRTFRSTVYVALPVPEQLPYSGYATGAKEEVVCAPNSFFNKTTLHVTHTYTLF